MPTRATSTLAPLVILMSLHHPPSHAEPPPHTADPATPHEGHGHHGNPEDLAGYVAKMEEPSRDEWQKPDEVLRLLDVKPGQTACDIGAGPGYFALRLARAVGPRGHVFAVDVEPRMLDVLRDRIGKLDGSGKASPSGKASVADSSSSRADSTAPAASTTTCASCSVSWPSAST